MPRRRTLETIQLSTGNRALRLAWSLVWLLLYRPSPAPLHAWRRLLLRLFGAAVATGAHPYPRARIWAPWNLSMAAHSCLANDVDCYCVAPIALGAHATVSQYSFLCSASHDYRDPAMPLVAAPIVIGPDAWIAADVFVGPGVSIGAGAVIGARSTVLADVEAWSVVGGSPLRQLDRRQPFDRART
jgi:putative colanic acid biosynthesis acetyltransferase WcaF